MEIAKWYNEKKYSLILDSFEQIVLEKNNQNFYILGLVLFELGYIKEAVKILMEILKQNNTEYPFDTSRGITYLALGFFSMGKYDLAKSNLAIASNMKGEFSGESKKWDILLHLSDKVKKFYENDFLRF